MLWTQPYIVIAMIEMGVGFVITSLIINERSRSAYFKSLYFIQLVVNTMAFGAFLIEYVHFVSDHFVIEGALQGILIHLPDPDALIQQLLAISIILTILTGILYLMVRSTEKNTIGNLFYSNTTPIAILNDAELFDSNQAFDEVIKGTSLSHLRNQEKVTISGKTYLVKRYRSQSLFTRNGILTLVLQDVSDQEVALRRLDQLDKRLSMVSLLLKNKLDLLEKLIALKSKNQIAIELHDEIGHNLTLSISLLERMKDPELRKSIPEGSIERMLEEGMLITESLTHESHRPILGDYLQEMLESYILYLKWVGIRVDLDFPEQPLRLTQNGIMSLYAICKEAFSNTVKYGRADVVKVIISIRKRNLEELLELRIEDNGLGCHRIIEGNGLKAIRARVERNGGSFIYDGNRGFAMVCVFPLQQISEVTI